VIIRMSVVANDVTDERWLVSGALESVLHSAGAPPIYNATLRELSAPLITDRNGMRRVWHSRSDW